MEWTFKVLDEMSDPLTAMAKSSKDLEHKLKEAGTELEKLERIAKLDEIKKMTDPLQRQIATLRLYKDDLHRASEAQREAHESGGMLHKLFGAEGFFAAEMIEKAAEFGHKILELGERFAETAIEAAQFKRRALSVFDLMLGGKEAAGEEFEQLQKIVRGSTATKQEVLSQYQQMFSFTDRFGVRATEDVIAAGADIQKALGSNASGAFLGVIRNIEAMGGLNQRTIRQLRETGIATPTKVYDALAADLHTTSKGAQNLIKAGKISQEQSITTLLKLVQTRIDKGGSLGSFSVERSSKNVTDQLKNLKEEYESVFQDIDTTPIADALAHIAHMFAKGTESGDAMREKAEKLFSAIAKGAEFAGEHLPGFVDWLTATLEVLEKIAVVLKPVVWGMKAVANVGFMAASIATGEGPRTMDDADAIDKQNRSKEQAAKDDIARMEAQIDALSAATADKVAANDTLAAAMQKSGIDTGAGFMEGLASSVTPDATGKIFQEGVLDALASKLDMHSPSRVMIKQGGFAGMGWNIGFNREMNASGMFGGSTGGGFSAGGMLAPIAPSLSGSTSGKSVVVNAHTEIKFDGQAPTNPQQQADMQHQIDTSVQRGIMRALEQLGAEN